MYEFRFKVGVAGGYHVRHHFYYQKKPIPLCVGVLCLFLFLSTGVSLGQPVPILIYQPEGFFPDQIGNEWRYDGRILEGTVNQIADKKFENVSKVMGTEKIGGVNVMVFHDTNPGDQEATDSYYFRDAAGIRYYGSKPGTRLEKQLIPYQVVRFPLEIPSSFEQLNRTNLNLGLDIDRDGQAEKVDILATMTIHDQSPVTVPLGSYEKAVRMEAKMKMLVHLSRDGRQVKGFDAMTVWFVKDIGLVKYTERQMVPSPSTGKDRMIEITEELKEAKLQGGTQLLSRRKNSMHGILRDHSLNHKLLQVSFPTGFDSHP